MILGYRPYLEVAGRVSPSWRTGVTHPSELAAKSAYVNISTLMEVQIFGLKKSADTRKALRFFAERRIKTHFVDLLQRAASPGELRRFAERFGAEGLLDRDSKRFAELGLRQAMYSPDRWMQKLVDEPLLLRVPLVRYGSRLTIGTAEEEWSRWIADSKSA